MLSNQETESTAKTRRRNVDADAGLGLTLPPLLLILSGFWFRKDRDIVSIRKRAWR
jgi:hypothetical protein